LIVQRFQEVEEKHLQQMKDFIDIYIKSWNNQYALLGQVTSLFVFTKSYFNNKTLFVG